MFETGDKIISRNRIDQISKSRISIEYGYSLRLTKYKTYTLTNKFFDLGAICFEFIDDNDIKIHLSLQQFEQYFLSKKEIRKLKLKTLKI